MIPETFPNPSHDCSRCFPWCLGMVGKEIGIPEQIRARAGKNETDEPCSKEVPHGCIRAGEDAEACRAHRALACRVERQSSGVEETCAENSVGDCKMTYQSWVHCTKKGKRYGPYGPSGLSPLFPGQTGTGPCVTRSQHASMSAKSRQQFSLPLASRRLPASRENLM